MNINEQDKKQCSSAVPYEWWVAGGFDGTVYLHCSRTGQWGTAIDPSDEEKSKFRCSRMWGYWQGETLSNSYRWLDIARVRFCELPEDVRSTCSKHLRSLLARMLSDGPSENASIDALHARRQDISSLEQAILQLERVEFEHYLDLLHEVEMQTGYRRR